MPVEANELNSGKLKTFSNILPEVLIYKEIGNLSSDARFSTPCFIGAERIHLVRGKCSNFTSDIQYFGSSISAIRSSNLVTIKFLIGKQLEIEPKF